METFWPFICVITLIHAAVPCNVVPLNQDEISTKSAGQLEPMLKKVVTVSASRQSSWEVSPRNVSSLRIERISICCIELIRNECQRMFIEAFLRRYFTRLNRAGLELKVSFVMCCEYTFKLNGSLFFVASLCDWREYSLSNGIRRIVVVVVANFATASFSPTYVEAVRAVLRSWVVGRPAKPNGVNGGVVVPGAW